MDEVFTFSFLLFIIMSNTEIIPVISTTTTDIPTSTLQSTTDAHIASSDLTLSRSLVTSNPSTSKIAQSAILKSGTTTALTVSPTIVSSSSMFVSLSQTTAGSSSLGGISSKFTSTSKIASTVKPVKAITSDNQTSTETSVRASDLKTIIHSSIPASNTSTVLSRSSTDAESNASTSSTSNADSNITTEERTTTRGLNTSEISAQPRNSSDLITIPTSSSNTVTNTSRVTSENGTTTVFANVSTTTLTTMSTKSVTNLSSVSVAITRFAGSVSTITSSVMDVNTTLKSSGTEKSVGYDKELVIIFGAAIGLGIIVTIVFCIVKGRKETKQERFLSGGDDIEISSSKF